jgi:hypothetical protein
MATKRKENLSMFNFKKTHLSLLVGLLAPVCSFASSHYCIAVNSGFGKGGTTFVAPGFVLPAAGNCSAWSGFTKTATSVVLATSGSGCVSSDGKVLTVSVSSADPDYYGSGQAHSDYIQLCPAGSKGCPIGSGRDIGENSGPAAPVSCSSSLLTLPSKHD